MGFLDKATRSLAKAVDQYGDTMERDSVKPGRIPGQRTGTRHPDSPGDGPRQPRRRRDARDSRDSRDTRDDEARRR
jgi:hypothetical protein